MARCLATLACLLLALLPAGLGATEPDPDNPDVLCGCCSCYNFSGTKLIAGGTEISGASPGNSTDCAKVSTDGEGRIPMQLDLPPVTGTCHDCNLTSLTAVMRDSEGKEGPVGQILIAEWKSPMTIEVRCARPDSSPTVCLTFCITWDCDDTCDTGCSSEDASVGGTFEPQGSLSSIRLWIPIGKSNFGRQRAALELHLGTVTNTGPSALKLRGWAGITHTMSGNAVATVTTQSVTTTIAADPLSVDPNGYTVVLSRGGVDFRTITIENPSPTVFQVSSEFNDKTSVMQWTKSGSTWTLVENGMRKTERTETEAAGIKTVREKVYEMLSPDVLVSDVLTQYGLYGGQWKRVKETIDPDGAKLVSTWSYYAIGEITGPGSFEGVSRLKQFKRYDGYSEWHNYYKSGTTAIHAVTSPYGAGEKTTTTSWIPGPKTLRKEEWVGGNLISKSETLYGTNGVAYRRYVTASTYLETVREYMPVGTSGLGGRPLRVTNPDGSGSTYEYDLVTSPGELITKRKDGYLSGDVVVEGTITETTTNKDGRTIKQLTKAIGVDVTLEDWIVTAHSLGRPTEITWFASSPNTWTTKRSYACCGIKDETDKFGIVTKYKYDDMRRRIRTNRLNVTVATVYAGNEISTFRYEETVTGDLFTVSPTNEISLSVTNIAGTSHVTWGPSPETGNFTKLAWESTTYANPAGAAPVFLGPGLGTRTIRTEAIKGAATASQRTLHYFDGRLFRSWGLLSPAVAKGYGSAAAGKTETTWKISGTVNSAGIGGTLVEELLESHNVGGRPVHSFQAGRIDTSYDYNTNGQLNYTQDADGVRTMYAYNNLGERTTTARKLNGASAIDYLVDEITRTETVPALRGPNNAQIEVLRTTTSVWVPGSATGTVVSTSERTPDGFYSWSKSFGSPFESSSVLSPAVAGSWTELQVGRDGSKTLTSYAGWKWASTQVQDAVGATFSSQTAASYDGLNRLTGRTDLRTGTTAIEYMSLISDVTKKTTPAGVVARATSYTYDHRGQIVELDAPDSLVHGGTPVSNITTTIYTTYGQIDTVSGGQTYLVSYLYDYAGRMKTMKTTGSAGEATTTWNYSTANGLLTGKLDPSGKGANYTYTQAGRLLTREWARKVDPEDSGSPRVKTTYSYPYGRLKTVTYNDGTPALGYIYDRLGRVLTVSRGVATHFTYTYDLENLALETEYQNDAGFSLRLLTRKTDDRLRPAGYLLGTLTDPDAISEVTYAYDTAGRFASVNYERDPGTGTPPAAQTFTYGYKYDVSGGYHVGAAAGANPSHIPFTLGGPAHIARNSYEADRGALRAKLNENSGGTHRSSYTYGVNHLGQRTALDLSVALGGGISDSIAWGYNTAGELVSADSTAADARDRFYDYDGIGNRLTSRTATATGSGGTLTEYFRQSAGTNLGANLLNQYGRISVAGGTPSDPIHDEDGNLKVDGKKWRFTWDAENRLVQAQTYDGDPAPRRIQYRYDHLSRCYFREAFNWDSSNSVWASASSERWVYDGWNRIEMASLSGTVMEEYIWGLDLSGGMQGAGGVGGMLLWSRTKDSPVNWESYYPLYDGNGNVTELLDSSGDVAAHWQYDPFGNTTHSAPAPVDAFSPVSHFAYRFSTKPLDPDTGLYYYGYRWYDPFTGRWPSRDPIEEEGGLNLYWFIGNSGISRWDYLGLQAPMLDSNGNWLSPYGLPKPKGLGEPPDDETKIMHHRRAQLLERRVNNCCDKATITAGRTPLIEAYENYRKRQRATGIVGVGYDKDTAVTSCFGQNEPIMGELGLIPPCWECELVRGAKVPIIGGLDHWWVECTAYDKNGGKSDTLIFDAYYDEKGGSDGGNPGFRFPFPAGISPFEANTAAGKHATCDGKVIGVNDSMIGKSK